MDICNRNRTLAVLNVFVKVRQLFTISRMWLRDDALRSVLLAIDGSFGVGSYTGQF